MTDGPLKLGGVPEHFNLPWHRAIDSEACAELDLIWQDQRGGTGQMLTALENRELDMVSILTEGTVSAIANGAELTILQVYVTTPLQWGLFVPAHSAAKDISELAGARIAVSRFKSGSHLMSFILAKQNGWTLSDDQFVVVGNLDGAVEAFADARADLFLWDRFMTSPLVDAGHFRQIGVVNTPWPSFVIAVRNEVLAARTTEVGRVADAVVAEAVALHGSADIEQKIAARYDLEPEVVKTWLEATSFAGRSAMDPTIADRVLDTLAQAGFN